MKRPKAPAKTAEEVAMERRQTMLLDKEISEEEERFKTLARGKYGKSSLLSGVGSTRAQASGTGGGTGRGTSMLGRASGPAGGVQGGGSRPVGTGNYSQR